MESVLEKWLSDFGPSTANTYFYALQKFKKNLGINDLGEYLKSKPNVLADFKTFAQSLKGKPPKTISTYTGAVKVFFADHDLDIPSKDLRKLRRRNIVPKRARAITPDKIPTKAQLRRILNYMDIKGRAIILFLASTGCRIGETVKLKKIDLKLDDDPPKAEIRSLNTKGREAGRTVYMSYESRDAIKDWLNVRGSLKKRSGEGSYESELVYPYLVNNARGMWNRACRKAGLEEKDEITGRRLYHLHSLRKFFRTNVGLSDNYVHSLMGHVGYLDDAYYRPDQEDIAKAYLENMHRVSLYELDSELKATVDKLEKELDERSSDFDNRLNEIRNTVKRFVGRSPEELEEMIEYWDSNKIDIWEKESREADYLARATRPRKHIQDNGYWKIYCKYKWINVE